MILAKSEVVIKVDSRHSLWDWVGAFFMIGVTFRLHFQLS